MRMQREWYGKKSNGAAMPPLTGIKLTEMCVYLPEWLACEGEIIKFSEQALEAGFTDLEAVTAKARTMSHIKRIKTQRGR
jgi:hypothetical protein